MKEDEIRGNVRRRYGQIAREGSFGCGCSPGCCGESEKGAPVSTAFGYSAEDLGAVPEGSDLGLGCGNPVALASLEEGETVLDLGSGAGFDCFLASQRVGPSGRVIGVDMTHEMLEKARENANKGGYSNVEFRLGEIEHLPVADNSVDLVISNCVINLSTDKPQVFREIFRVLRPGGRIMIADIVLTEPLPPLLKESALMYTSCVAGALLREEYLDDIEKAGFSEITIISESIFPLEHIISEPALQEMVRDPGTGETMPADAIVSIRVRAEKKE